MDVCYTVFVEGDMDDQDAPVWSLGLPFMRAYYTQFDKGNSRCWGSHSLNFSVVKQYSDVAKRSSGRNSVTGTKRRQDQAGSARKRSICKRRRKIAARSGCSSHQTCAPEYRKKTKGQTAVLVPQDTRIQGKRWSQADVIVKQDPQDTETRQTTRSGSCASPT
ncbi:hypothetical protein PoB_002596500 [Plakobranchus ocellatus]|uniref:Peptidase A1 domain-containing protein n=1 Tax=Plakobranchus ocellatus TaxID=259542 RepID=A0AAV3ZXS2_9GAST|nr:hypothetical protein PoB_002596500 [Plakobranchus ocellatus]